MVISSFLSCSSELLKLDTKSGITIRVSEDLLDAFKSLIDRKKEDHNGLAGLLRRLITCHVQ